MNRNLSIASARRGAAKQWLIGCGIALAALLLVVVGGGVIGYNFLKDKVSYGTFDVATKTDPALDAPPEAVLPPEASGFTRDEISGAGSKGEPLPADAQTSSGITAVYSKGAESVRVFAVPTANAEAEGPMGMKAQQKPQIGKGVHIRMGIGDNPLDVAMWTNPNWTYVVQTSGTQALAFAEQFQPLGTAESAAPVATPATPPLDPQ